MREVPAANLNARAQLRKDQQRPGLLARSAEYKPPIWPSLDEQRALSGYQRFDPAFAAATHDITLSIEDVKD